MKNPAWLPDSTWRDISEAPTDGTRIWVLPETPGYVPPCIMRWHVTDDPRLASAFGAAHFRIRSWTKDDGKYAFSAKFWKQVEDE